MRLPSLRNLISVIGLCVVGSTCVVGPLVYFLIAFGNIDREFTFRATVSAERVAKYAYLHPKTWEYQTPRLAELIESDGFQIADAIQRVVSADGATLVEVGSDVAAPTLVRTAAIERAGKQIGRTEVVVSLRPLVLNTMLATIFSCMFGLGMYFAAHRLPLAVLDRTLGALHASQQHLEDANGRFAAQNVRLRRRDEALGLQNSRFDAALANMSQGLMMFNARGELVVFNQRFIDMFAFPAGVLMPCIPASEIITRVRALNCITTYDLERVADCLKILRNGKRSETIVLERTDGRSFSVHHEPTSDGGWVDTFTDITEQRRHESRIAHMAHHDALTDLPNRALFYEHLSESLGRRKPDESCAVFVLDFDDFKNVNDTLGHPAGDALLKEMAERLRKMTTEGGLAARLGGDEFAVVLSGDEAAATAFASRLIDTAGGLYNLDGREISASVSIGITLAPNDGSTPESLLKNADLALYRAKDEHGGTFRFFEPQMDARIRAKRALEIDLRTAIIERQFELYYQPLVSIASGRITGLEALIRWNHPRRGRISPAEFIPLAEETGLIVPIGAWALQRACADAASWPDEISVEVNVSPVQFRRSSQLIAQVDAALAASGLPPHRLELEITESVVLNDDEFSLATLHQLRDAGIRIAMDDFGTGYSSLGYLRKFPFDKIKIDQTFVRDLNEDDSSVAIIRAIVGVSSSLHVITTAEGVETAQQLERVRREGCTEAQGFFFSAPRPANEITYMLRELRPQTGVTG